MAETDSLWRRLGSLGGRTITILLVLVVVVAVADKSGWLSDWSADRRFTLSPRLTTLLKDQPEPISLVGIWTAADAAQIEAIEAMLTRMTTVSSRISWQRLDPELQKPLVSDFAQRFGDAQPGTLYVTRGQRAFAIAVNPLTRLVLQREVGGALVSLGEADLPRAYLVQGHGELRPQGGAENGNDRLTQALGLAGYQLDVVDNARRQPPSPEGILVVAGPVAPLGEHDLTILSRHLQDGGGLVIVADDRTPDDLTRWLRRRGVFLGLPGSGDPGDDAGNPGQIVVSLHHHFVGQEAAFPHHNLLLGEGQLNPQHEVTKPLALSGIEILAPWSTPVHVIHPDARDPRAGALIARYRDLGTPPFHGEPLLTTLAADAWLKPRAAPLAAPEDLSQRGALPLAWAIEYQPAVDSVRAGIGGRLVVIGSRQVFADGILAQASFANERLLRAAAAWAARRSTPSDIPEAEITAFQVTASDNGLFIILGLLVALVPCICLGAAMLTWWDRR